MALKLNNLSPCTYWNVQLFQQKLLNRLRYSTFKIMAESLAQGGHSQDSDARRSVFRQPAAVCPKWHRRGGVGDEISKIHIAI